MSRKNKSRVIKKMKRKDRRKKERLEKMKQAVKISNTNNDTAGDQQSVVNSILKENFNNQKEDQQQQQPSTSRNFKKITSPKKNFRKSPCGRVNRFKKIKNIIEQQDRMLYKRRAFLINNNQTPRKTFLGKKGAKRLINKSNSEERSTHVVKQICNSQTWEESEIRSDDEKSFKNSTEEEEEDDDDDDCVVIEPTIDEITIEDDNDNNLPLASDSTTNYQSIVHTFMECVSSTPCHRNPNTSKDCYNLAQSFSDALVAENVTSVNQSSSDETLPFFVDVGHGSVIKTINSGDSLTEYPTLSTLRESSVVRRRRNVCVKEGICDEIIDLDDVMTNKPPSLKRKSCELADDSVIFVSETNRNDFIPIVDDNIPPNKILKVNENLSTPVSKIRLSNTLFTKSETKKLNEYNDNAYNPSANKELSTGKRMVIIDGSNVAFKHGLDQGFSVKGIKIAIEYFEKMGHEVKAVIPQFRMNKGKSTDPEELEKLNKTGKIVQTPCKNLPGLSSTSYDDRFILQLAFELDAAIVSNDNYRDLLHENPAFKKIIENRVVGYTWCNDIFILPKDPYGKWGPKLHTILNRC